MTVRRWVGWRTTTHTFGTKHFCLVGVGATSSSHHVFRASPAPVPLPGVLTVLTVSPPDPLSRCTLPHSLPGRGLYDAATPLVLSFARSLVLSTPRYLYLVPLSTLLRTHTKSPTRRVTYTIDSQFSQRIPVFFPPTKDAYSSTRREKVENWLACGR